MIEFSGTTWTRVLWLWRNMPFYAVRRGRNAGIYKTWDECKAQVNGFPKARYKKFASEMEANDFVNDTAADSRPTTRVNASTYSTSSGRPLRYVKKTSTVPASEAMSHFNMDCDENTDNSLYKITYTKTVYMQPSGSYSISSKGNKENRTGSSHGRAVVYTDGGCSNNGQRGAQAGIGVFWGTNDPRNVSERLSGRQTNNRAEIHAACRAIQQAKEQGIQTINIKTDSQFLINAATKWINGWVRNNWRLAGGGPVLNREDFEHLIEVSEGIDIEWDHVRGHTGIFGNEEADKLANDGASKPLT